MKLLTGATGALGPHLLSHLASLPRVTKIYCPIRLSPTSPSQTALKRLQSSLTSHNFPHLLVSHKTKIYPLPSNLSEPDLGLPSSVLDEIRKTTTHIIHAAWQVNFALPVSSFISQLAISRVIRGMTAGMLLKDHGIYIE